MRETKAIHFSRLAELLCELSGLFSLAVGSVAALPVSKEEDSASSSMSLLKEVSLPLMLLAMLVLLVLLRNVEVDRWVIQTAHPTSINTSPNYADTQINCSIHYFTSHTG